MAEIRVVMQNWEYADLCAKRLCSFWKIDEKHFGQCSDIVEHYIDGLDEVPSVMKFVDNLNYRTFCFGAEEVTDFIINELEVDLNGLFAHLNLDLDSYDDGIEKCDVLKEYLEDIDINTVDKLNDYIQYNHSNKGDFYLVYGSSHKICSYLI